MIGYVDTPLGRATLTDDLIWESPNPAFTELLNVAFGWSIEPPGHHHLRPGVTRLLELGKAFQVEPMVAPEPEIGEEGEPDPVT